MIQRIIKKWKSKTLQVANLGGRPKTESYKQLLARAGEKFARQYLERLGWVVQEMNWRSGRHAEIDIIARDKTKTWVFVEVKARRKSRNEFGFVQAGFESIDDRKRGKIVTGALHYLAKHKLLEDKYRFDAIVLYYPELQICSAALHEIAPEVIHVSDIF